MPAQASSLRNTVVMCIVSAGRGADGKIPIVRRRVVGAGPGGRRGDCGARVSEREGRSAAVAAAITLQTTAIRRMLRLRQ